MIPLDVPTQSIAQQLDDLAAINRDPVAGGVTREVFSAEYTAANHRVAGLMESAGLDVRIDAFGNLFGRFEGKAPAEPAILTGSHIDTTLNAGRFDGVLGVLGAIEALRALRAAGWEPTRSVEVVCFAGEEPRFGSGCLGSRALTGDLTRIELDTMCDRDGVTVATAMREVGLDPERIAEVRLDPAGVHAFVELHIEQGSVLEAAGLPVGVVTHIAAPHDLRVVVGGAAAHAGATPMSMRRDAFAGAAEATSLLERLAQTSPSRSTVATVGVVHVRPGAINVVPAETELHVDIRDHDLAARTAVVDAFRAGLDEIATRRGLEIDVETIRHDRPAVCDLKVVDAARAACDDLDQPYLDVISGAYHDAMVLGAHVPIGMIFVPSVGGISHSPLEYTAPEDIERGVGVLAATLRRLADDVH
ncbi:MAG: allantoate amidohydrolase [Solirubrobacteraceae bacterium]